MSAGVVRMVDIMRRGEVRGKYQVGMRGAGDLRK